MTKSCAACGAAFEAKRPGAKYCGDRCRKRAQRNPGLRAAPVTPAAVEEDGPAPAGTCLADAARSELAAAGRVETAAGQVVLALARRIDAATAQEMGSSLAALTKEFRAALTEAVADAVQAEDPVDELRAKRDSKRLG